MPVKNPVDAENSSVNENSETANKSVENSETKNEPVANEWETEKEKILSKQKEILNEKKKLQEELQKIRDTQKKQEEEKLKEQERYKELADKREKELEELRKQRETELTAFKEAKKMNLFLKEVGGLKQDKYQNLVDLDKIIIDSDGNIDKNTLKDYVSQFKTEYPELIKSTEKQENKPPQNAPRNTPEVDFSKLSYSEQLKYFSKMTK